MDNETVNEFFSSQQQKDDSVRPEIVQTAISFLQNKNVINTPLAQKQKFLQRKGLSSKEIQMACQQSGAYSLHDSSQNMQPQLPMQPFQQPNRFMVQPPTVFQQLKDIFHTATVFSFVAYALYKFYEKFIRPFLFGPKKSVADKVDDLEKNVHTSVSKLNEDVLSVKTEIEKITNISSSSTQRMLQNLQSEVATVKGLLLSRKQFPSTVNNPVVPPSIPAWQMSSVVGEHSEADHDPKSEDLIEVGSGDGSEPDNRTKTSDSSLEIM